MRRKTKGNKEQNRIRLVFTLELPINYKDLIVEIKDKWGNAGNWLLSKKYNTIRYQITNRKDLLNIVIPFLINYPLRGEKVLAFLRFKYILEKVDTNREYLRNKDDLLSLIVIAGQISPRDKLGNKIRYLKPEEAKYVINNTIPQGVDISSLTLTIANFKQQQNPLTLDFVKGLLLETGSNNIRKVSKTDQNYIKNNFPKLMSSQCEEEDEDPPPPEEEENKAGLSPVVKLNKNKKINNNFSTNCQQKKNSFFCRRESREVAVFYKSGKFVLFFTFPIKSYRPNFLMTIGLLQKVLRLCTLWL